MLMKISLWQSGILKKRKWLILYGLKLIVWSFHYKASTEEYSRLERALKLSRSILAYVNQAVKDCENRNKLRMLQRRIDKKQMDSPEFKVNTLYLYLILDKACFHNSGNISTLQFSHSDYQQGTIILANDMTICNQSHHKVHWPFDKRGWKHWFF